MEDSRDVPLLLPEDGQEYLGSFSRTFGNIIISIVGSGVLGLPFTFSKGGWLLGSLSICLSAIICYYTNILLIRCKKKLVSEGHTGIHSYSDLGNHAYGDIGHKAVDFLVLLSQGGCCVAYLIFIGENIASIARTAFLNKDALIVFLTPFQVLLAWVRSLTGLAPFSMLADVANLLALGVVIKDDFGNLKSFSEVQAFGGWEYVPFTMGIAVYCYEGFSLTIPLEASMKDRKKFPLALGLAMIFITFLYVSFGLIGYLAYGDLTKEIITLNLPNDISTVLVKFALCISLFFTFPVMMHPVHEIFERRFQNISVFKETLREHPYLKKLFNRTVRLLVVVIAAYLAIKVPGFATFCSLLGATVCALIAFVLPAIFHLHVFGSSLSNLEYIVDGGLIFVGLVFAVVGTYDTFSQVFGIHL